MLQKGFMNQAMFMGNLTDNPGLQVSQNGNSYCRFTLAVNYRNAATKKSTATYIRAVAYGKQAEYICKSYSKGDKLLVQGSMSNDRYKNEEKGTYKDSMVLNVNEFAAQKTQKDAKKAIDQELDKSPAPVEAPPEFTQPKMPMEPYFDFTQYEELESE